MAISYTRTNWQNRVVERPRTYDETVNDDQSVTHTPAPGTVVQAGTALNETHFNNMEDGIEACVEECNRLDEAKLEEAVYLITIPATGWSSGSAPCTQTVSVTGMLSTDTPIIDLNLTGTYATDEIMRDDWSLVYRIVTGNGSITVYADDVPSAAIRIRARCLRNG